MENSSTQIELQDQRSRENSGSHHWIVFNVSNVFNAWRPVSLPGKTTGRRSEDRGEGLGPTLGTPQYLDKSKGRTSRGGGKGARGVSCPEPGERVSKQKRVLPAVEKPR